MRRTFLGAALAVALGVLVVACGEGSAQVTDTVEPAPPGTLHPAALFTPTPIPTPAANSWFVTASPDHGPVGTRVHLEGEGFTDPYWQNAERPGGYAVFLLTQFGSVTEFCELIADTDATIEITDDGHLSADFTVPAAGHCFQTDRGDLVRPGEYAIGVGCHACHVATFHVTAAD